VKPTHLGATGRDCIIDASHGPSLIIGARNVEWCPHSGHTSPKVPSPALLSKQQDWLDTREAQRDKPKRRPRRTDAA
jgi:hypothetical protein